MDNERQLLLCTPCKVIRPFVMCPRYMDELQAIEISLQDLYVFQITCKCWSFFWFQNHLHQLRIIRCKVTLYCLKFCIHSITQIKASISECSTDSISECSTDSLLYSSPQVKHQNLSGYCTTLVRSRGHDPSMIHP